MNIFQTSIDSHQLIPDTPHIVPVLNSSCMLEGGKVVSRDAYGNKKENC